jgi:hypothetical protein
LNRLVNRWGGPAPANGFTSSSEILDKIQLRIHVAVEDHRIENLVHWQLVEGIILRWAELQGCITRPKFAFLAAQRLVEKIDSAYVSGPDSPLWPELKRILPRATFKFFADRIRYQDIEAQAPSRAIAKPTWADLRLIFEADMARRVERYRQGELKDILAPRTEKHYKEIMDCFEEFLQNENTLLTDIRPDVVEKYRAERRKKLASNGGSVPGHIAVLHIVFRFAVDREIMPKNPINLKNETKPGENPKSPARPLAADELQSLRASG